MDVFLMYLWTRLDALHFLFSGVVAVSSIALFLVIVFGTILNDELKEMGLIGARNRITRVGLWLVAVCSILSVLVPTTKDVALIIAGTGAYRIATSERTSKVVNAFADYVEEQALSILKKKEKR